MAVYQTYVNAMNDKIRRQIAINNPFVFRHISNLKVKDNHYLIRTEFLLVIQVIKFIYKHVI